VKIHQIIVEYKREVTAKNLASRLLESVERNDIAYKEEVLKLQNKNIESNELIKHIYNSGIYQRNPLNFKEVILHQEDDKLVLVQLSPSQLGSDWVHVNFIRAVPTKSGVGKIGMSKLKALAQKFGYGLEGQVWEKGSVSADKLRKFYTDQGFTLRDDDTFIWEPETPVNEKKARMHLRDLTNEASDEETSYQEIQFLPIKYDDVKTRDFKSDLKSIDGVISVVKKQPNGKIQISAIIENSADTNILLDLAKKYGIAISKNHTVTDAYVNKALGGKLKNQDEAEYLSPDDIHQLADKKGIPWDNDPEFLELTKRLTGKAHLDSLDNRELEKVKKYLEQLPQSSNKFEKAGYQQLDTNLWMKDQGTMAKLLMQDSADRSESKAIRLFWELTKKYPNLPNLPKFMQDNGEEYSEIKIKNAPYVMFNMEQLNPIAENSAEENLVYELNRAIREGKAWQTVWEKVKKRPEFVDNVNYTAPRFKILYKTLELLNKVAKINNYTLDTDLDSVMIRPRTGELVFTLPWRLQ
jgi:hypothetical protein